MRGLNLLFLVLVSLQCEGLGLPPDEAETYSRLVLPLLEAPGVLTASSSVLVRPMNLLPFSVALQRAGMVIGSPGIQ